jgi:Zn/Cd-binding protein ZinT
MKNYEIDTSEEYEDYVGYVSDENVSKNSLSDFLGEERGEYKPHIKEKAVDPDFPEDWQKLFIAFETEADMVEFMAKTGIVITPKMTSTIYETKVDGVGLFNFFGD